MDRNNAIGKDNALPWHIPTDLKYFKSITMGKPILMGRKTFESIGRPLPGRKNIVLTRDTAWQVDGVTAINDVRKAYSETTDDAELMVIGGAEIYRAMISEADRLYITEVDLVVDADTHFPPVKPEEWREISREVHAAEGQSPAHAFVVYERV
jgi:dihydrofolate reductase